MNRADVKIVSGPLHLLDAGHYATQINVLDGWENECFAPTWFCFDGEPFDRPATPPRIGADAPEILAEFGYSSEDIERLVSTGAVGQTEWMPVKSGCYSKSKLLF